VAFKADSDGNQSVARNGVQGRQTLPYWDEDSSEQYRRDKVRVDIDCDSWGHISIIGWPAQLRSFLTCFVVPPESARNQS